MSDIVIIESNRDGDQQYGDVVIRKGSNDIPKNQYDKFLKPDKGFKRMVEKGYFTELTHKEIKQENEVKNVKAASKAEIDNLKSTHAAEIADMKKAHGEAMRKLANSKDEKINELVGEIKRFNETKKQEKKDK